MSSGVWAFEKPWQRDSHLPKLDVRLLPALERRRWSTDEFVEYCHEAVGGGVLEASLIERWLVSADERGLAEQWSSGEGGKRRVYWAITERGLSRGRLVSGVLSRLGGVGGIAGIVSLAFAIVGSNVLSPSLQPIVVLAFILAAVMLGGFVFGATLAERSNTLLRVVAKREAEVQAVQPAR